MVPVTLEQTDLSHNFPTADIACSVNFYKRNLILAQALASLLD